MHMSLGGKINPDTGAVTFTTRTVLEFPSTACVKSMTFSAMTGKAIVQIYGHIDSVPTSSFEVKPSDPGNKTVLHIHGESDSSDCGTYRLVISVDHGASVTLSEIEYCPAVEEVHAASAAQHALRRRTVNDQGIDDATVHFNASYPIIPRAYCNRHIISDGSHSYCYAVFGYSSRNNVTVFLSHNSSYYVGARHYNENPALYYPCDDTLELSAFWICDRHTSPYLKLIICTPMDGTLSHLDQQCYSAVIFRDFKHRCEDELVDWIDPELVPSLFSDDE